MGDFLGFRLSAQQRRAWSLWRENASARAWCALEVTGPLDDGALRDAAEKIVETHEILRTTFHRQAGMRWPVQAVGGGTPIDWEATGPFGRSDTACVSETVARLVHEQAGIPLELSVGPALRLRLRTIASGRHVLLLSVPALCADRASLHAASAELVDRYAGRGSGPGEPPIQYADYAQWREELSADEETARAGREHWRRVTESASEFGGAWRSLPRDGRGDAAGFSLSPEIALRIDEICLARGFSAADFLLACWQILLARASGEAGAAVASVEDGRGLAELHGAIGLFSVALPVCFDLDPNASVADAAAAVADSRRQNAEWQEHLDPSGESPQDAPRALPGFEFFERRALPDGGGASFSISSDFSQVDAFPISVVCERTPGGIRILCASDPASRLGPSGGWVAEHFEPFVLAAVRDPDARATSVSMLPDAERHRLLVEWNETASDFPSDRTIHEIFEDAVRRSPEAPAVVCGATRLTYGEANARANAIAWFLKDRSVGPGAAVGLALERSAETIVALLGVLKAGGAYVPLVPDHPPARLALQLEQSGCQWVITEGRWKSSFAEFGGETIDLETNRDALDRGRVDDPPRQADPTDLAYVMYTSGSTGVPKGVRVRHRSLVNYTHFVARDLLGLAPAASPLAFATVSTISADLGNTAIFAALSTGGCLHVIPYETSMDGARFADSVARDPVDVLKIVPSHLSALLSSGGAGVLPRRALILGGETLSRDLVDRLRAMRPGLEIVHHYGPTETTIGSLTFRLPPARGGDSGAIPIGRPIANTRAYIVDSQGEPVPEGVAGELWIGGAGVAAGYCNLPNETADRFIDDHLSGISGERLYRTGDRARWLSNGNVEFLGRIDDQVKIRGFRVEPGEVRVAVAAHPAVHDTVVIAREDDPGERRLVAYVVPARGAAFSSDELKAWVRGRLPDYMVPAAFVSMKAIPLTSNGKVDLRALPAPEAGPRHEYVAPRTASEAIVADTWREVLRVERVGAEDDFFDLGGHSLLLTQVVSRLRRTFERDLPIRWVFESPTVAGLAARIDAAQREDVSRLLDEIEGLPENESSHQGIEP